MSRHTKKNSSSRYSQTSARRSSSQPWGGSMRTMEGTLACSGRGATDCGGAVTDAIDLALLNLAHQVVPMKQVILQMGRELPRHDEELVVDHLAPGNRPARGNQVPAPLKHERRVPENEAGEHRRSGRERHALRAEERGSAFEQNA